MLTVKTYKALCLFFSIVFFLSQGTSPQKTSGSQINSNPLPRYEEGKTRTYDPNSIQRFPAAVYPLRIAATPTGLDIFTPPDYAKNRGILLRWGAWNSIIKQLILEAADRDNGSSVALIVGGDTQLAKALSFLDMAGINKNQVKVVKCKTDSIWIRDYGPHFIKRGRELAIVDSRYLASRPLDEVLPVKIHRFWEWPLKRLPLKHSGGNLLVNTRREGFLTDVVHTENLEQSPQRIAYLFWKYIGLEALHLFAAFPPSIDRTGHIDMWMTLLSDHTVMIGQYENNNPAYEAAVITEKAVSYMQNLGYIVYRTPGWNDGPDGYMGTHFTYTNSILLNQKILIPQYGGAYVKEDAEALNTYSMAMPEKTIIGVDCAAIIEFGGALHCISKNVPQRYSSIRQRE